MLLFKINNGGDDITTHIVAPTYKVNEQPVYEEWTDSNYTLHREVVRRKVQGTFTVKFDVASEMNSFINQLRTIQNSDGSVPVLIYVHNLRQVKEKNVFVECDPANTIPLLNHEQDEGFEVTITER